MYMNEHLSLLFLPYGHNVSLGSEPKHPQGLLKPRLSQNYTYYKGSALHMHDVRTVHMHTLTYTHPYTHRAALDGSTLLLWSYLALMVLSNHHVAMLI